MKKIWKQILKRTAAFMVALVTVLGMLPYTGYVLAESGDPVEKLEFENGTEDLSVSADEDTYTNEVTEDSMRDASNTIVYSVSSGDTIATVEEESGAVTRIEGQSGIVTILAEEKDSDDETVRSGSYQLIFRKKVSDFAFAETEWTDEDGNDIGIKVLFLNDAIYGTYQNKAASEESDGNVTYESDDEAVATVDEEGTVTVLKAGMVTITAKIAMSGDGVIEGGKTTYQICVKTEDETFAFEDQGQALYIETGKTGQNKAASEVTDPANDQREITYESGDTDIATVDGTGTVIGMKRGETTITATISANGTYTKKRISYRVYVYGPLAFLHGTEPQSVSSDTDEYENPVINESIIPGGMVRYAIDSEHSDPDVAEVDAQGTVTRKKGKYGTVTVKASVTKASELCQTDSYALTFRKALSDEEFKFDKTTGDGTATIALTIDESDTNKATSDISDGEITYKSSNTNVASVDASGTVTAVGAGDATITAEIEQSSDGKLEGKSISYKIHVKKKEQTLAFEKSSLTNMYVGMQVSADMSIGNKLTSDGPGAITYSSSAPDYVEVDRSGNLTVKRITGEQITITATKAGDTTFNSTTAAYTLRVGYRPLVDSSAAYRITGAKANESDWYVGNVTVTAGEDYLISETVNGIYGTSILFSDEQTSSRTFYLKYNNAASDYNGAISEVKESILIDKTKPVGQVSVEGLYGPWNTLLGTLTYGIYSNTPMSIHVDCEDGGSGIDDVKYRISSGHEPKTAEQLTEAQDWETYQGNVHIAPDQDSVVFVKLTDKAGNVTYLCTDELLLDSTAPTVTIELPEEAYPVYQGTVAADVRVSDPVRNDSYSGLKTIDYEVYNQNQLTQSGNLFSNDKNRGDAAWEGTVTVLSESNNSNEVQMWIIAEDLAGNVTREKRDIKIDTTKPEVQISFRETDGSASNSIYSKLGKTATIQVTERNFDANRMDIQIVGSAGDAPAISEWSKREGTGNGDDTVYTATVTFSQSGKYQLRVSGEDAAGNQSTELSETVVIDFTAPNVSFALPESDYEIYHENVTVSVEVSDPVVGNSNSGISEISYEVYTMSTLSQAGTLYTETSGNIRKDWSGSVAVDAAKNNSNQVEVWITVSDLAGNVSTEKKTIKIDTTAPTVQISYRELDGSVSESVYSRQGKVAMIQVTERNFDANRMDIQIVSSAGEVSAISGWNKKEGTGNGDDTVYTTTVTLSQSGDYQLQVSGEDAAGNRSATLSENVMIDITAPDVSFTMPESEHGIYNHNVTVNVAVNDPVVGNSNSGIKNIAYEVYNRSTLTQSGTLYSENTGNIKKDWSGSVTVDAAGNNSNQVEVWIVVSDFAGNVNTVKQELWIDVTAPVIEVSYDNNNGDSSFADGIYFNAQRTATIRITERNFDEEDVDISITNSEGEIPVVSGWSNTAGTGNGDDSVYTATITYKEDGDYTFAISYADRAGNVAGAVDYGNSLAATAFTIDRVLPTITVAYDNNDARNGSYYNQMRTGTITIDEHNFETGRVRLNVTATDGGQSVVAPAITGWTHAGDIHRATIAFSADAMYHWNLSYTDKAGNEAVGYNSEEFYVDTTAPSVTVSGIADHSANNDDRIQLTVESTDTNFDVFDVDLRTVVLNEGKFEKKKVDGVITTTSNGARFTVNNLESDGIYTLKCTAVDKAGNAFDKVSIVGADKTEENLPRSSEDTLLMFSVNREGSTFMLNENSMNLVNNYYVQNVNENIEIVETNADPIKEHELTLNHVALREGTDYTVQESGGDGEWYQYVYAVNKALFAEEGEYKLVVASVDKTDTTAYSDVKDLDISFVIDQTAPTVTVSGLQESGRYQTQKQAVTIVPTDDGGKLKSVQVDLHTSDAGVSDVLFAMADQELEGYLAEHSGRVELEIPEGINMDVVITCRDCARDVTGNTNEAVVKYSHVTVSPKGFVIFYANKPLFVGTVAGATTAVGAGAGVSIFTIRRRRFRMIRKK